MGWLVILIIIVIVGALLGGESFGEMIRGGCGCLVLVVIAAAMFLFILSKA